MKITSLVISAAVVVVLAALTGCAGGPTQHTDASANKAGMTGVANNSASKSETPKASPANQKLTPEQAAAKLKVGMDFSELENSLPPPRNVTMSSNGERMFFYNWGGSEIPSSGSLMAEAAINALPFSGLFTGPSDLKKARARQAAYRSLTVRVKDGKVVDFQFSPPLRVAQSSETSGQAVVSSR